MAVERLSGIRNDLAHTLEAHMDFSQLLEKVVRQVRRAYQDLEISPQCICNMEAVLTERFGDVELVERLSSLQVRMHREEMAFLQRNFEDIVGSIRRIERNQEKMMRCQERQKQKMKHHGRCLRDINAHVAHVKELMLSQAGSGHPNRKRPSIGCSEPPAKISRGSSSNYLERGVVSRQQENLLPQGVCDKYISSLSAGVRKNARQKIEDGLFDITNDYAIFLYHAQKALEGSIPTADLLSLLVILPCFTKDSSTVLLSEKREEIKRAETTGAIFSILRHEFSFLNCDPLLKCEPLVKLMNGLVVDYSKKLEEYVMSHEIYQLTGGKPHSDLFSGRELVLVLDLGKTQTLSKMEDIPKVLAHILRDRVAASDLIICDINTHSN